MSADESRKREHIQSELRAIEAQNETSTNREQLRQREDKIKNDVESIADPVLRSEYRRRLSVLRGNS